jgi:putative protease
MSTTPKYSIELLAPARNAATAIEAIKHGADAVYMGASSHGARAAASNSVADVASVVEFAHRFRAKVYVTLNTLIYKEEIPRVERLVRELYAIGVDALIVQDLGVLRMNIPPIALHASTQCDIRTPATARFLEDLGFSQLVLPREFTLDEIRAVRSATTVPLEAFVHGALCVSFSGDCYASLACGGRSANRGECAQICRLPYTLTDGRGETLAHDKYLLSLSDLNQLQNLEALIAAGVSSLKIEGRLKDDVYVKNVVSAYDIALRRLGVARTSCGDVERTFTPDVSRSFNRGYCSYFLTNRQPEHLATMHTPKSIGEEVAKVVSVDGKRVTIAAMSDKTLANGDGLTFLNPKENNAVEGFRVNNVLNPTQFTLQRPVEGLTRGMALRRNFDKAFADALQGVETAVRTLPLDMTLRRAGSLLVLESGGVVATLEMPEPQTAKTPQAEARRRVLAKLGGTDYRLHSLDDRLADEFVPASVLTSLRRNLLEMLQVANAATRVADLRRPEKADAKAPDNALTYHANVANRLAEAVYRAHGVTGAIEPAPEVKLPDGEMVVMTTRHCIRRELGLCLKTERGRRCPAPLTLTSGRIALSLHFDCANCQMQISRGV